MSKIFTSSGGVGDLLIVGAKLSNLNIPCPQLVHLEKHEIQKKALTELMDWYVNMSLVMPNSQAQIHPQPYKTAISLVGVEECYPSSDQYSADGGYIATYCNDRMNPFFYISTPPANIPKPYIIINCVAGRTNDSTRRVISADVIKQIRAIAPKHHIVCLSVTNEFPQVPGILCVQTPTIISAFAVINECAGFIGQDGVLSYYAMMQKKPTYVSFHLKELPDHYMHPEWAARTAVCIHHNIVTSIPPSLLTRFQKLLENPA